MTSLLTTMNLGAVMLLDGIPKAKMLFYLMIATGITGIIKVLFSSNGRISVNGITFQWRR